MNLMTMEYFSVLAKERNFTRAAEVLHITQQTLSAHIAGLEKELGCRLLVRRVPLELTYAGKVFLKYAQEFQEKLKDLKQEFSDITNNQQGVLKVGIALVWGSSLMPKAILDFQKLFPNVSVEISEENPDVLQTKLLNGEIDLAVGKFPRDLPGMILEEYYEEEIVLTVREDLLLRTYGIDVQRVLDSFRQGDFSRLSECPLLLRPFGYVSGHVAEGFLRKLRIDRPLVKAESANIDILFSLCLDGAGAFFCPKTLAASAQRGLLVFPIGDEARYHNRFAVKEGAYQWSVISAFMDCARNVIPVRRG